MKQIRIIGTILLLGATLSVMVGGLPVWGWVAAQAPPPPPTKSPAPTPTDTGVPPPTDTPTETPPPATAEPTRTLAPPQRTAAPNPDCQSAVSGYVRDRQGKGVAGATVSIQGEDWTKAMMTNDEGLYGFAGLCAGTVTLQATLPDGQMTLNATVDLDGKNYVVLDLGLAAEGATSVPAATAVPGGQTTPTPEPEMPQTGYAGWWLAGGALLGLLVLLLAGARRTLKQQS